MPGIYTITYSATDASMDVLAGMPKLEVLNLYRTKITNSGLAKLQTLKGLADIDVRYSLVTPNGIDALHAAIPAAAVRAVASAAPRVVAPGAAKPMLAPLIRFGAAQVPVRRGWLFRLLRESDLPLRRRCGGAFGASLQMC